MLLDTAFAIPVRRAKEKSLRDRGKLRQAGALKSTFFRVRWLDTAFAIPVRRAKEKSLRDGGKLRQAGAL